MLLNVIYTLEIQDGENRYTQHTPVIVKCNGADDIERINEVGEQTAKQFLSEPTSEKQNSGDWYELEYGCRMIRYKSFEIINSDETFKLIERILYK